MPAPKLSRTSSLAFVRDQLVFTHTRLLLDARIASLAAPMAELLVQWSEVDAEQALGCADFCRCPFSHQTSMNGKRATHATMTFTIPRGPQRIVCLTEEPTELLYLLGEEHRIVGITAYTVRPPEAMKSKPVVSAFIGGSIARIKALNPDLIIGFSDVQAEYARSLIAEGLPVMIFNQRSLAEILEVLVTMGQMVGAESRVRTLVEGYVRRLDAVQEESQKLVRRPRVYFEEWDEPMISCIRWVHELIEIAGGQNIFGEASLSAASKGRIVTVEQVQKAAPEVILASWCGKALDEASLRARLGEDVPAIRDGRIYEVPSEIILQPGPACLTDGLDALVRLIHQEAVYSPAP